MLASMLRSTSLHKAYSGLKPLGLALLSAPLSIAAFAQETTVTTPIAAPAAEPASIASFALPHDLSPWGMFMTADIIVKVVMVGLALASVATWSVWLGKSLEIATAGRRVRKAVRILAQSRNLVEAAERTLSIRGPASQIVQAATVELRMSVDMPADGIKERVASRFDRIESRAGRRMMRGTGILATVGSIGPFVGLFGTVWGIMNSFIGISKSQTTNLAVVAPGIAEALLATAIGLVAAIPAVVIYNILARSITGYRANVADVSAEVLRLVSRDLDRVALHGHGDAVVEPLRPVRPKAAE